MLLDAQGLFRLTQHVEEVIVRKEEESGELELLFENVVVELLYHAVDCRVSSLQGLKTTGHTTRIQDGWLACCSCHMAPPVAIYPLELLSDGWELVPDVLRTEDWL